MNGRRTATLLLIMLVAMAWNSPALADRHECTTLDTILFYPGDTNELFTRWQHFTAEAKKFYGLDDDLLDEEYYQWRDDVTEQSPRCYPLHDHMNLLEWISTDLILRVVHSIGRETIPETLKTAAQR